MKRILKILLYFLLGVLGLIFILLIFTQTSWFKDILKDQAESIVSDQLNGNITIGKIEGNFFDNVKILNLRIHQKGTTLIYVDDVSLKYNLNSIVFKKITINSIQIDSIYFFLKQENDSSWNVSNLIKDTGQEEADTSEGEFDWNINLNLFEILRSEVQIATLDSSSKIPSRISDINLSASGSLTAEQKKLLVKSFRLVTEKPDFKLKDFSLFITAGKNKVDIEKFKLTTPKNKVELNAEYYPKNTGKSKLNLSTAPVHFEEYKPFVPNLSISAKPVIIIDGKYNGSKANIVLSIKDSSQSIRLKGLADNIKTIPDFEFDIIIDALELGPWVGNKQLQSTINGNIDLKGSGNSLETLDLSSRLNVYDSKINNLKLDSLDVKAEFKDKDLMSHISLVSEFGLLTGKINLKGIQKENQFALNFDLSKINTAAIMNDNELKSNINFSLSAVGDGLNLSEMNSDIRLNMKKSSFRNYSINSIDSKFNVSDEIYSIEKFDLLSDYADLNVSGNVSLTKNNDVSFKLVPKDIASLPDLNQFKNVSLNGKLNGNIQGPINSLNSIINFSFNDITFQNNSLNNFNGKIDVTKNNDSLNGHIITNLKNLNINSDSYSIKNIQLNSDFTKNRIISELLADINDTSNAEINSVVMLDSVVTLYVNNLNYEISNYQWHNLKDTMIVTIGDGKYKFKNFELSNGRQSIFVQGFLDPENENNLGVKIKDFDLGELLSTVKKNIDLYAKINLDLDLKGTFKDPKVKGKIGLADFNYKNEIKGSGDANLEIKDEKFKYDLSLVLNNNEMKTNGYIPLDLSDTNSVIPKDKPLDINIDLNFPNLSLISKYIEPIDKFDGHINSELKLTNDLNNLDINGFFKIDNASLSSEMYGLNYNKINLDLKADGKNYLMNNLTIENNEGKITIDGSADFKEGIISGSPDNYRINLTAEEFEMANSRKKKKKIDGNINIVKELNDTKFDGEMKVLRSRIFLPFFTGSKSGNENDGNKPILIKELEKARKKNDSTLVTSVKTNKDSLFENKVVENVKGKFKLRIPKNTWVVSPDLNIELSGDVDVLKNGNSFELYGTIETVRGKLSVYGKEFSIKKGRIIFNGGVELNPGLNVQLEHMFRGTDRNKRYLELIVTGTAKKPKLSFKVDDNEIDEGNAISFLMFGKSLDELSQSQKSNVKNSSGDLAATLAGNLVAGQLKNTLGDALGLDVIEINGENSWKQTSLTAGKYLTDDLYVSYEKGFGSSETNELNPAIITLEYALTSFLNFQLVEGNDKTAGFDIIFKFDY